MDNLALLIPLTGLVALLYASVGHGGASGYLAAMALLGAAPESMKPTALVLNLLVSGVGSARYIREGHFRWRAFWPFALGSIPLAFFGGAAQIADDVYRRALGVVLMFTALALLLRMTRDGEPADPPVAAGIGTGSGIGFVSGLIGVGGGIFLSPLLILARWATTRQTLGIASLFIHVNSASGLAGHVSSLRALPAETPYLALAAFAGGLIGTELGSKRASVVWLRRLLACVLAVAASKLLLA